MFDYVYDPSKSFLTPWQGTVASVNRKASETAGEFRSPAQAQAENDFGYRVQVRVVGEHPPEKGALPDEELPFAIVTNSVTAGSGTETPQIRAGDIVGGYIITGNYYLTWVGNKPGKSPLPFTPSLVNGFEPFVERPYQVPTFAEYNGQYIPNLWDANLIGTIGDFKRGSEDTGEIPCPHEVINAGGMMTELDKLIQKVENAKKSVSTFSSNLQADISRIEADILEDIAETAETISKGIADAIKWIQERITKKVNEIARSVANVVPINSRFTIREGMNIFIEALYCLFNKIMDGLVGMIADFLQNAIDQFVNAPLCAIENMLTGILGSVVAAVNSMITGLASKISGFAGAVTGLISGVLDAIGDLLALFKCEPEDECPETKEWNILDAAGQNGFPGISLGITDIVEQAIAVKDSFADVVSFVYDDNGNILGVNVNDLAFDITSSLKDFSCNGAPVFCGPPKVVFWGGGGSGATGNAIVDTLGQVIGIDIVNPGRGYSKAPFVSIVDECGIGNGVVADAVIGPIDDDATIPEKVFPIPDDALPGDREEDEISDDACPIPAFRERTKKRALTPDYSKYGVTSVIIRERGTGFSTRFDGSVGGRGRVWAESKQTYVRRSNGVYELPLNPGESIELNKCDQVFPPSRIPYQVDSDTVLTAPVEDRTPAAVENAILDNGKYPVVLYLCDTIIETSGISYKDTDKVKVVPDNGAKIEPTFSANGQLTKLTILDHGSEITGAVDVIIESDTGFNARIIPIICMDKDNKVRGGTPLATIDIVDCVGKVPVVTKPIGYVNGQPYSGPFHVHPSTGVKMVGAVHIDGYHDTIYDTAQESLNRRRSVTTSVSTTETQSSAPTPTRTSAPTPTPTPTPSPTPMPAPSPTPPSNPSPPPSSPGGGSGYGY